MVFGLLELYGTLMIASIIGGVIYLIRSNIYKDEPDNAPIIINGLADYCDGYALGTIISIERNKEKTKIVFSPRDIDYIKLKNQKEKIKNQTIFVKNNLLFNLGFSSHRQIFMALPENIRTIKDNNGSIEINNMLMQIIEYKNVKMDVLKIKEIKEQSMLSLLSESKEGGAKIMDRAVSQFKELADNLVNEKKAKDKEEVV